MTRKVKKINYIDKMSKGKIQELYQTSDDDSGIPRQARLDSNSQTTKPNSLVCLYKL
jgi:hypothetical protein